MHAIDLGLVGPQHNLGEIGEILTGSVLGRTAASDITVYKSLGIAAQDLAAAHLVYQRAVIMGLGICILI